MLRIALPQQSLAAPGLIGLASLLLRRSQGTVWLPASDLRRKGIHLANKVLKLEGWRVRPGGRDRRKS